MRRHFLSLAHATVVVCVCLAGVIALSYISSQAHEAERAFFYNVLRNAHSNETVRIGKETYTLVDGVVTSPATVSKESELRALKLAYEKIVARRDPILALPGTDLPRMRDAVAFLATTSRALANIQNTSAEAYVVSHTLFPIEFLETATEAEEARRRFLNTGDVEDSLRYRASVERALAAYQRNLRAFISGFETVVPNTSVQYAAMGGTISRDFAHNILRALQERAVEIEREQMDRMSCFSGLTMFCDANVLHNELPQRINQTTLSETQTKTLDLYKEVGLRIAEEDAVIVSEGHCRAGGKFFNVYAPQAVSAGNTNYERALPLDDVALVRADQQSDIPFFSYLIQRGVEFVPVVPTHYTCVGFAQDHSALYAVRLVRTSAASTPFSAHATGTMAAHLRSLEDALHTAPVHENDARKYVALAHSLTDIPPAAQQRLDTLTTILASNTAGFEEFLFDVASIEYRNVLLSTKGVHVELSAPYIFFIRSAFFDTFLAYTPSLLGSKAHDFFPLPNQGTKDPYTTISEVSSAEYTKAQQDIHTYYALHTDFLEQP